VDIFTFYVPHRHVYGEQWIKFMKDGVNATPLPTVNTTGYIDHAALDRKSGSAGMPRPISYAVFCLKKKKTTSVSSISIIRGITRIQLSMAKTTPWGVRAR